MLCKALQDIIIENFSGSIYSDQQDKTIHWLNKSYLNYFLPDKIDTKFKCTLLNYTGTERTDEKTCWLSMYKGISIFKYYHTTQPWYDLPYTQETDITLTKSEIINWFKVQLSNGSYAFTANYSLQINIPINLDLPFMIKWKPRELKQIAQKASITIFWVHTDNSRVSQS